MRTARCSCARHCVHMLATGLVTVAVCIGTLACEASSGGRDATTDSEGQGEDAAGQNEDAASGDHSQDNQEQAGTEDGALPAENESAAAMDALFMNAVNSFSTSAQFSITALLDLGHSHGGYPIEGRLFWYVANNWDTTLHLTGDFDQWAVADSGTQMQKVQNGSQTLYYKILGGTVMGNYKLVEAPSNFFANPYNSWFNFDENGEISATAPNTAWRRTLFWLNGSTREVRVFMPAHLSGPAPWPLLLMLDGQNVWSHCKLINESLPACWDADTAINDLQAQLIVAGVFNSPDRFDEYTTVADNIVDGHTVMGGQGTEHLQWIMDTVLPVLESEYPIDSNLVSFAGSSLGGLLAASAWQLHGDRLAAVGAFSATLVWGSGLNDAEAFLPAIQSDFPYGPSVTPTPIYVYTGGSGPSCIDTDGDGIEDDGQSSDNFCVNQQFVGILQDQGWNSPEDYLYTVTPNAPHSESSWAVAFADTFLPWLLARLSP